MDAPTALVKGFFAGFVVAQFITGWVSGPLIVVLILLYVFSSRVLEQGHKYLTQVFGAWSVLQRIGVFHEAEEKPVWNEAMTPPVFGPPV